MAFDQFHWSHRACCADMEQLFMRPAGHTSQLRKLLGFGKVQLLCRQEDYMVVQGLYEFTTQVLCILLQIC